MPGGRLGCGLPPGRPQEHDALRPDRCPAVSIAAAGCIPPFPGVPGRVKDRKKKTKTLCSACSALGGLSGTGLFSRYFRSGYPISTALSPSSAEAGGQVFSSVSRVLHTGPRPLGRAKAQERQAGLRTFPCSPADRKESAE